MKSPGRLAILALLSVSSLFARASSIDDFKMDVLDPPPPLAASPFPTFPITSLTFAVTFTACQTDELPNGLTADGCFSGVNRTGVGWSALGFTFPNTDALGSQPVSCSPAASDNIFSSSGCDLDGSTYGLTYFNGVLGSGQFFFVVETGVDPALFPPGVATATALSSVPEPNSLILLGTGLALGLVAWKVRA